MAALPFDVLLHDSQAIPDSLPGAIPETVYISHTGEQFDRTGLSDDQASNLGYTSGFAGIGLLDSPAKVLRHLALHDAQKAALAAQAIANAPKPTAQERAAKADTRKSKAAVVEAHNMAWRDAIRKRKEAELVWAGKVAELAAQRRAEMEKWDAHVEQLRAVYHNARDA
jgi:signal transduction protein with GAF and PtsI domain